MSIGEPHWDMLRKTANDQREMQRQWLVPPPTHVTVSHAILQLVHSLWLQKPTSDIVTRQTSGCRVMRLIHQEQDERRGHGLGIVFVADHEEMPVCPQSSCGPRGYRRRARSLLSDGGRMSWSGGKRCGPAWVLRPPAVSCDARCFADPFGAQSCQARRVRGHFRRDLPFARHPYTKTQARSVADRRRKKGPGTGHRQRQGQEGVAITSKQRKAC